MREGGWHGGGICFDNRSFPKIPGNHIPGLATWKSLRSKGWDKILLLSHSLLSQLPFSASFSQCQKVSVCKDPYFPPESVCCLLLGHHGLQEGLGIWVSNCFLQDLFTQVHLILLALATILCYSQALAPNLCNSPNPQHKHFGQFLCRTKCLQTLQVGFLMPGKPPTVNPCPAHSRNLP